MLTYMVTLIFHNDAKDAWIDEWVSAIALPSYYFIAVSVFLV